MKRSELFFIFLLVPIDIAALICAFTLAYFIRLQTDIVFVWSFTDYLGFVLRFVPIWLLIFALLGSYKNTRLKSGALDDFANIFIGVSSGITLMVVYLFLSRTEFFSRLIVLYALIFAIVFVFIARQIVKAIQRALYRYGLGVHRVLVIGKEDTHNEVIASINQDKTSGLRIIKIVPKTDLPDLTRIIEENHIDEIMIADSTIPESTIVEISEFAQERGVGIKIIPSLFRVKMGNIIFHTIAGLPLVEFKRTPLDGWGAISKRLTDIILSIVFMIILSPLFLFIALVIKITSPGGPVIFKQKRVGYNKEFYFLKFRSMVPNAEKMHEQLMAEHGNMFKLKNDPRVTVFGRFLRKTSLDELPQFWNVLQGDMSLVGPRPPMPEEVKLYRSFERRRLGVKPGITGLWQVSGRSDLTFEEWVKLDVFYIENWSLWLDIKIMLKTIIVVLKGRGAY